MKRNGDDDDDDDNDDEAVNTSYHSCRSSWQFKVEFKKR